jgi:hypothetical protein
MLKRREAERTMCLAEPVSSDGHLTSQSADVLRTLRRYQRSRANLSSFMIEMVEIMNTEEIIALIDGEISKLQRAKVLLTGAEEKKVPGSPSVTATPVKRVRSAESKANMAKAQAVRSAKARRAAKKAARAAAEKPVEKALKTPTSAKSVKATATSKSVKSAAAPSKSAAAPSKSAAAPIAKP